MDASSYPLDLVLEFPDFQFLRSIQSQTLIALHNKRDTLHNKRDSDHRAEVILLG